MSFDRDLRYALRILRRTPGFTLPAVASIALAVALNTTLFSIVNAVLLRPLAGVGELVRIGRTQGETRGFRSATYEELDYLRRHASSFQAVIGHQLESVTLAAPGGAQVVSAEMVTGDYFTALGVQPDPGRALTRDDDRAPGGRPVAVISRRLWRSRFAADPSVVERIVRVNNVPLAIAGVAPARFHGTFPGVDVDLWIPSMMANAVAHRPGRRLPDSLALTATLRPGVDVRTADAEVRVLGRRMASEDPARDRSRGFVAEAARGVHPLFARVARPFLLLLLTVTAVVLLIACANVASLLLARASVRRAELAVRVATGASRHHLVGQLLVEASLVAVAGGAGGLLLSSWAIQLLNATSLASGPTGSRIFLDLRLDARVLLFTLAITLLTTVFFGLLPSVQATRGDLVAALRDSASSAGRVRSRVRSALLVLQVACSFVLLTAAALLFQSLRNTASIDLGFDPDRVVVTSFNLQMLGYEPPRVEAFYEELLRGARALPGAERAALSEFVPLGGRGYKVPVTVVGASVSDDQSGIAYNGVSDGYFAAIGHALTRGREFVPGDRTGPPVAIVNEAMARKYFPGGDALGGRVRVNAGQETEIVGIAADARYGSYGADDGPFIFLPLRRYPAWLTLHVRAAAPAADTLAAIGRIAHELDPNAAPQAAGPMRDATALALLPAHVAHLVFSIAGAIALLLATGGLYGVVSHTLAQRLKEIGIRVALGASRSNVFRAIVGSTVRLSAIGIAIGAVLALLGTQLLASILYGLGSTDPATFGAVAILLVLVTLAAAYAAARHGLDVDPIVVLRRE